MSQSAGDINGKKDELNLNKRTNSPKKQVRCNKCEYVCDTERTLAEHEKTQWCGIISL